MCPASLSLRTLALLDQACKPVLLDELFVGDVIFIHCTIGPRFLSSAKSKFVNLPDFQLIPYGEFLIDFLMIKSMTIGTRKYAALSNARK